MLDPVAWPEPEARHRPWFGVEDVLVCEAEKASEDSRKGGAMDFARRDAPGLRDEFRLLASAVILVPVRPSGS